MFLRDLGLPGGSQSKFLVVCEPELSLTSYSWFHNYGKGP